MAIAISAAGIAYANDVEVSNVSLQNYNGSASPKTVDIKFDLSQKNVFPAGLTDGNGASYFDRVWIFVKYFNNAWAADTAWKHATIVAGGSVGAYSGGTGFTADGKGAFVRPGVNQTLRWAIGTDESGTTGTETYKIRVFAIEMVYIPQGAFWIGGISTEIGGPFTDGSWTSGAGTPIKIISEDALTIGQSAGNIWITNTTGWDTIGDPGPLPAEFPKGYNGFFIMKYEVSQGQYRDFLNTLTRAQQNTRTATALAAGTTAVTNVFVMSLTPTVSYRNGIACASTMPGSGPITFFCDLNANGVGNEADDGEWLACNWLNWTDAAAFADWAGLRPMTEMEFEKAARGRKSATDTAAANVTGSEFAWGGYTGTIFTFSDLSNAGTVNETKGPTQPLANCNYSDAVPDGPVRCGMFATSSSTRQEAGASYYGVMELSGNVIEPCVSVGDAVGRAFTGLHGDGALDATGNANATNWPPTAVGTGQRGSAFDDAYVWALVASRDRGTITDGGRYRRNGCRAVRTAS